MELRYKINSSKSRLYNFMKIMVTGWVKVVKLRDFLGDIDERARHKPGKFFKKTFITTLFAFTFLKYTFFQ